MSVFRIEFRDKRKASSQYLSALNGDKCINNISQEERDSTIEMLTSNSIAESLHASSTDAFVVCGTMILYHATTLGQSRSNRDHD